jgi:hypothetical protein
MIHLAPEVARAVHRTRSGMAEFGRRPSLTASGRAAYRRARRRRSQRVGVAIRAAAFR